LDIWWRVCVNVVMDYLLKMAEELHQQFANLSLPDEVPYKSVYTINGCPILPPLMTPERRLEMQLHRQSAVALEEKMVRLSKSPTSAKLLSLAVSKASRKCVDASTNTDPECELVWHLSPPPLIVAGRIRQRLQCSETLIYDNKCNAIIKYVRRDAAKETPSQATLVAMSVHSQQLPEEPPQLWPQLAIVREAPRNYATLTIVLCEQSAVPNPAPNPAPLPMLESPRTSPKAPPKSCLLEGTVVLGRPITNLSALTPPKEEAIKKLLDVARKLNEDSISTARELHRSNTSPALSLEIAKSVAAASVLQPSLVGDQRERLHPQLWKRYNSYPPYLLKGYPAEATAPISPNFRTSLGLLCQNVDKTVSPTNSGSCGKMEAAKQREMPEELQSTRIKPKPKALAVSQQKASSSRSAKRTPRASSAVSYTAHASCHANAEGASSDNSARMSSTQRRLSYDPRATIKRASTLKRSSTVSSSCIAPSGSAAVTAANPSTASGAGSSQTFPLAATASSSNNTELLKRKMLEDMEQQQRLRFQQLMSQQADEQQRLQDEFKSQQQLLLDQMASELRIYTSDREE
ncbi:hypothetical protein KR222_001145, partial [Zaprionus bogoriensis]